MPESLHFASDDPFSNLGQFNSLYAKNSDAIGIDARETVFLSALAARAFALQNGRNPRDLKELVPRYLQKVETDPFNRARSLIYSAKPKTYPFFVLGKPIFKPPLPLNATPLPTPVPPPPAPPLEEGDDPLPVDPPMAPQPLGYLSTSRRTTLPFLLYSVGQNGRDDGGMDFKAAALPFWKATWPGAMTCDDILAPARWFNVTELEKHERDEQNSRLFRYPTGVPSAPPT